MSLNERNLNLKNPFLLLVFLVVMLGANAQFYSGSQQEFGQNRIQYRDFLWQYYKFEKFETYFYKGGKLLAQYTAKYVAEHLPDYEKRFDFFLNERVQFVIYNTQSDFRQSNIGVNSDNNYNIGGVTRIVGYKVFLYFEGDYQSFTDQIKASLARIILSQLLYGGNWREMMRSSTFLIVPEWYEKGLISYLSEGWTVNAQDHIRDAIEYEKYRKINRLESVEAKYFGHALWNYIVEVYGENVLPNILYMTRISRSIESGFTYVLGIGLDHLIEKTELFYKKRFAEQKGFSISPSTDPLNLKTKKTRTYNQFKLSPDGKKLVYVSNEMGQIKLWLADLVEYKQRVEEAGERKTVRLKGKKIFKAEHKLNRIVDNTYPVVTWHPYGEAFAFITEQKGKVWMNIYDLTERKITRRELFRIHKVIDLQYADDGKTMIFSGVVNGQSDLYLYYNIGNRQEQLTNDIYDDLNPRFIEGSTKIIFSSNRSNDTLNVVKNSELDHLTNDIFIYDLVTKNPVLKRITNTPYYNETNPAEYASNRYTYLSDENGVINRFVSTYDSVISNIDTTIHYRYFTTAQPVSNLTRNIREYEILPKTKQYTQLTIESGKYNLYINSLRNDKILQFNAQSEAEGIDEKAKTLIVSKRPVQIKVDANQKNTEQPELDTDNYVFLDNDKQENSSKKNSTLVQTVEVEKKEFKFPTHRNYNINFTTDYVVTQLDNTYSNTTYQRFVTGGSTVQNPGLGGMLKLGISDLFENYKIVGGINPSFDLNNTEYMLSYRDLSKRLDKEYVFNRMTITDDNIPPYKVNTQQFRCLLSYPFSEVSSIRANLLLRYDRLVLLSIDQQTLNTDNQNRHNSGVALSYIFDNTINRGLNLYSGTRLKIFGEYYQDFQGQNGDFFVTGIDARNYFKIHHNIIWANRFAASSSFGSNKLIYFMGGVDNWILGKFDQTIQIDFDQNYAYQTLATPMRGFFQNARNGANFAVLNSEIRFPVFSYFLDKPIKSDFVRNFQIIGFGDVGSAWTGLHPYAEDNSFNNETVTQEPITVVLTKQVEPIIVGYGGGIRSRVLGYFMRADIAWGTDDGQALKPVFYYSLSLDF